MAILFHAMNSKRSRVTGRTNLHRLHGRHAVRNRHDTIAVDARVFRVAAINRFAETATVDEHSRAHLKASIVGTDNGAGEVNAAI